MVCIFTLNSQVVYGNVGAQAALPALHLMGHETLHLPTVLFSNHPGHNSYSGELVSLDLQSRLLAGLLEGDFLVNCGAIHTGYLGQPGSIDIALRGISAIRDGLVICDPVLGDEGRLYVPHDLANGIKNQLLPYADLITPNQFELSWLTDLKINSVNDAINAAQILRRQGPEIVVCTSALLIEDWLCNMAVCPDGIYLVHVPFVSNKQVVPKGTGDTFAAILFGHYLKHSNIGSALSWASSALHGLIQASIAANSDTLEIVRAQNEITAPTRIFEVEHLKK